MRSLTKPNHPARTAASYTLFVMSLCALAGLYFLIHSVAVKQDVKLLQETLIRTTLVKADVAAVVLDETGDIVLITPELSRMTGYSEKELLGKNPDILMPIAYRELHRRGYELRGIKDAKKKHQVYCQLRKKDGTTFQVINNVFAYDKGGIAIITPSAEQGFQDRLFTMARKEARVGVWWWEIKQDRLVWDNVMYDIFGVEEDKWKPSYEGFQASVVPEDRKWVNDVVAQCIADRSDYRAVFRVIKHNTGALIYIRAYGAVMEGINGPVFGGVNIEVTKDEYTGFPEYITQRPSATPRATGE